MKKLRTSILCTLFLLSAVNANLFAQSADDSENYYSNPQKGIKPTLPKAYHDSTVVTKTDDIIVDLIGVNPDSVAKRDTLRMKSLSGRAQSGFENPGYWGANIIYSWDPWYSPFYNSWYYPGWGGSHWMLSFGWGAGPYWSFGLGWNWGYGWVSPWCVWDPFFYPYSYYAWYGHPYGWGYPYGYGSWNYYGHNGFGHRYLGNTGRTNLSMPTSRSANGKAAAGRSTVRRGGVDLNNGGRAPRGSVSGTGNIGNRYSTSATSARSNSYSNARYAKPATVANNRVAQREARNSNRQSYSSGAARNSYGNTSRSSYNNRNSSTRSFDNRSSRSDSYNYRSNSSSRSSSRSTYNSSSSSRSSFGSGSSSRSSFGGGSSSRSSFGGGSSSRGGSSTGHSSRR